MSSEKIKKIIKNRKKDETSQFFAMLQEFENNFEKKARRIIKNEMTSMGLNLTVEQQLEKMVNTSVRRILGDIKGDTGNKGDKGDMPNMNQTARIAASFIRAPKDGVDGETPSESKLLKLIKPLIPKLRQPKDGSPDKPLIIAKKLNTLEEVLDFKVIKGMKEYMKKLETTIFYKKSGGGGGMGQPQHETFDVGSTTTSITTAFEIAADGRAIFGLRYEGQMLHWGEHYTVSGKTITLLETLSDNTIIDISYIRK